jgi:hypothetical protein
LAPLAISLNDKIVKDGDKLSRYSMEFRPAYHRWGSTPESLCDFLEPRIGDWFFLHESKEIAKKEFGKRKREIGLN